ncbi:uncharacterized protein LOC124490347 isoform X3 [Dermatophagoides farinae]|uniref:uncharacterized protein LOC124490347 isoform X3 n=1 Tax=Dermatophagoides farinae TaxID=6954 RepID=UPI003F608017
MNNMNLLLLSVALSFLQLLLLTPVPHNAQPSLNESTNLHPVSRNQVVRSDQSGSPPPPSSSTSYYTNDLSAFLSSVPTAIKSPSTSSAGNMAQYQALLQALAQAAPSSPSSPSSSSWMTLPTSWSSMVMTSPSSFMSMLRPMSSPIGGRRSSLTSRLRNIMNAIFYRRENNNTPMMTSGSSYSYSYRPAPYGFGNNNEMAADFSSLGSSPPAYLSSLYNSNGPSAERYVTGSGSKSSMHGAASSYRPSFVAVPSSSSPSFMSAGQWSSPIERPHVSGSMQGLYGRNYGHAAAYHHHYQPQQYHHHQQHQHQQLEQPSYHHRPQSSYVHQPAPHQQSQHYGPSMSESVPSIASAYNGQNGNQWSSPLQSNERPMQSGQVPISSLDGPFIGPNNAIWSQGQQGSSSSSNSHQPQQSQSSWSSSNVQDNGGRDVYSDNGSRDEGASYYTSNVFQSRISSSPLSSSSSQFKDQSSSSAMMPSPTYVGPKFDN